MEQKHSVLSVLPRVFVTGWASSLSEAGEGGVRDKPGLRPTWESKCTEEPARHWGRTEFEPQRRPALRRAVKPQQLGRRGRGREQTHRWTGQGGWPARTCSTCPWQRNKGDVMGKRQSLQQTRDDRTSMCDKRSLDTDIKPLMKINSKWAMEQSVKHKTAKPLEDDRGENLGRLGLGDESLDEIPKA